MTDGEASDLIAPIARRFAIDAALVGATRYGSGHINDTFMAAYANGASTTRYIHQRINKKVFSNVPELMENIGRVTRHVRGKLEDSGVRDVDRRVLTLVRTVDGGDVLCDPDGEYWRTYAFLEGSRSYDVVTSPAQAYEAARAFGEFSRMLADVPKPRLHDTIPRFHDTGSRLTTMFSTVAIDPVQRMTGAREELRFVQSREELADALPRLVREGQIPMRISHNDTKLNNVMLDDATGEGVCVIDLDTVMPGLALYDFGDMVRTATASAAEDERDIAKVFVQLPMFDAVVRGFASGTGAMLTPAERAHLVTAAKVITYTIGVRFLTDHLAGDVYFKVHREGHNLDRARTQFALIRSLEAQEEALQACVARAFSDFPAEVR